MTVMLMMPMHFDYNSVRVLICSKRHTTYISIGGKYSQPAYAAA